MSENAEKVISKPKVRFSQCSDNEKQKQGEKAVESCRQDRVAAPKRANGPKIRSIVTLKRPVRIVDPNKPIDTSDANVCPSNRETVASTRHDAAASKSTRETFSFKKNVSKVETSRILRNVNAKNTNPKVSRSDKIVHVRDGVSENRKTSQQKGKENKDVALKKTVPNKNISKTRMVRSHSAQLAMCKKMQHSASDIVAPVASTVDPKDSRMMKTQSVPNLGRKTTIQTSNVRVLGAKKSIVSGLIPCHKYIDVAKSKTPVKKIVLHNATSSRIKATVGPGIQRSKRRDDAKASDSNKKSAIASDKFTFGITAEKLAQPQYNSIKCTTNKLAELKRQKIVTDIDHLPPIQKNFVNEKISSALDFPLDEAIFKDLIDVSVDESQLPSAVTRSKDPEPRQKDISPKLSDFFIPEPLEEICMAVRVKPRASKIMEDWEISKISDKIFDWKLSLDDVQ